MSFAHLHRRAADSHGGDFAFGRVGFHAQDARAAHLEALFDNPLVSAGVPRLRVKRDSPRTPPRHCRSPGLRRRRDRARTCALARASRAAPGRGRTRKPRRSMRHSALSTRRLNPAGAGEGGAIAHGHDTGTACRTTTPAPHPSHRFPAGSASSPRSARDGRGSARFRNARGGELQIRRRARRVASTLMGTRPTSSPA